jgi:uncharacterized repeat protein (TIGR03847 family)
MSDSFDLETPDHFTTGAVGPPGQRVFYLQGRQERRLVTLKAEKEQMNALADYLEALLARLTGTPGAAPGDLALLEPLEPAWEVGSIGVGYDQDADRIVIIASERREQDDEEEDDDEEEAAEERRPEAEPEAATARFRLTRAQAAAFVERARSVVRAGRPTCPVCSGPMDPGGHVCPRSNGHVVRPS